MVSPLNPVQGPPPRRHHSFAGPVVLIIVGLVFLMGTMGMLNWFSLGQWFAHYWPVLLIVWGIIKLIEYERAKREGVRPAGLGAGGIFLLLLVIVFGLMATQASRFNWDALRDQIDANGGDFPFFGHTYNYEDQVQHAFPAGSTLRVVDDRGAVNLTISTDDQIHVIVHKRVSAERQEEADKWNAGTKPQITVSGNEVTVNADTQGAGDHPVTSDLEVSAAPQSRRRDRHAPRRRERARPGRRYRHHQPAWRRIGLRHQWQSQFESGPQLGPGVTGQLRCHHRRPGGRRFD